MKYDNNNLMIRAQTNPADPDLIVEVTPEKAGWEWIHFQARKLAEGEQWSFDTDGCELALVALSGTFGIQSNRGEWRRIGKRPSVFEGLPEALYLPPGTRLTVEAETNCQFAAAWVEASVEHPPRKIEQKDVTVELRGGDNATRHINGIIRPGFECSRLVVVEVYTPSGNWSSYPPHKHDRVMHDDQGTLTEADLEEIYYYKINPPEGYAFQRVYTDITSPLHAAGEPIETVVMPRNNDVVLVPEGYHPVVSAPGYTTYYLNILAGSHQALTALDDPIYTWVKGTYKSKDPRVPIYPVPKEQILP